MKEYKYKINGNLYKVSVGDIDGKNVHVEVNGTPYTVELEKEAAPKIKPIARAAAPAPAPAPAAPARSHIMPMARSMPVWARATSPRATTRRSAATAF